MNGSVNFMASTTGRIARIVAGIVLMAWGLLGLGSTTGIIVAVPLLVGVLEFCIFAPLFGCTFAGPKIRANR